jgi:nucleoside-diphosphate-sugar epimerase
MYFMSNDKKNILLVGGAGYLGSHLADSLFSYNVYSTSRTANAHCIELDLLSEATFNNISGHTYDIIILLASSLKGLGTTELKEEYINTDTIGLSRFLQFISGNKLSKKLIYISSMTVYGIANESPVKENSLLEPISTYGLSKVLAETIFSFYCNSNSLHGAILRIPGIYGGKRKSGFIYNTAIKCLKNQSVELNTSSLGYWETIQIDDLCKWISEFIANYDWLQNVDIFNISYGTKTDFIECSQLIKETLKSSSETKIIGDKGYQDFFLDNSKVKKYTSADNKYKESLTNYLKAISI